jgi:predicted metalloprotease with PDZ domain
LIATILCLLFFTATPAKADIHYTLSLGHPEQHLFHVTVEVPDVKDQLILQMAAWNALYEIRDFSGHVQEVVAFADGQPVDIKKLDKLTWQVKASGTITVRYSTFWDDVGPFSTQLNSEHAFINPAQILLYVPDRRAEKNTLSLLDVPAAWNVASAALTLLGSIGGLRSYSLSAPSYDALADAPIEASHFEEFTIHDLTPPVHVVIHGDNWHKREVENALRKICTYELKLMDGAPYDQYTFIFHVGNASAGGGGGMEHANSTAIFAPSDASLNSVSAHEFFHLWNVKRIRPASLEPVDYTKEMYTRALWFAEGVTNTYGSYALVRTGLWNKQEFSSVTFNGGAAGANAFVANVEKEAGVRISVGSHSSTAALKAYGVKRIAFLSPYYPVANAEVRRYFTDCGFDVVRDICLECKSWTGIAEVPPDVLREKLIALNGDGRDTDALIQVGTNLSMVRLAAAAELWLGKPVIAINTATYWHALRAYGIKDKIAGFGRLLEEF